MERCEDGPATRVERFIRGTPERGGGSLRGLRRATKASSGPAARTGGVFRADRAAWRYLLRPRGELVRARPMTSRSHRSRLATFLAIVAAALPGCRAPEQSLEPAHGGVVESPGTHEVTGDPEIERHLATVLRSSTERDGARVLGLELLNTGEQPLDFLYTVEWLDRAGLPLTQSAVVWHRQRLGAGASTEIEVMAPAPTAESWRLRAQSAER